MSRSTKAPYWTDQHRGRKVAKRLANKRVRHAKNVSNGGEFKYYSCSYDISDYNWYAPKDAKAHRK